MNQHELEGRLAALEFVAAISLRDTFRHFWVSAYTAFLPFLSEWIAKQIESGTIPGPSNPEARNEMKKAVIAMINAPDIPGNRDMQEISKKRASAHPSGDLSST